MAAELRSHMVPLLLRRARHLGIDVSDLVQRHAVDLDADAVRLRCRAVRALGDTVAERAGDPRFGFRTALELPRGAYGLIEYLVRNTSNLRALVGELVRYSRLINARLEVRFDDATGVVEQRIEGEPACLGKQGNEFSLAHQVKIVKEACGRPIPIARVFFAHEAPRHSEPEIQDYFGTRAIEYACGFNGVVLSAEALATRLDGADDALFRVLERRAAEVLETDAADDDLGRARRAIVQELGTVERRSLRAGRVAEALGSSERTLQRRLAAEGTTFGELVDDVRHELALRHLAAPERSVADVASLLGYADRRAFARAFRRWTKTTPTEWRQAR
jgi:AraC-like DNA-binding protein